MKVILLVARSGPGVSQNAGDEIEVDAEEGKRMIAANQARPVAKTERATKKRRTPETADK